MTAPLKREVPRRIPEDEGGAQLFGKTLFVDLMMGTLVIVSFLLIVSNAVEKAKRKRQDQSNIRTEGVFAVVLEWPDASADDVDLYVRDPEGHVVFFSARDLGLMHLEHDDQGTVSDEAQTVAGQVKVEKNEERVVLRGVIAGEYVVNAHMYNKRDGSATPVTASLLRLKGEDAEIVKRTKPFAQRGDQQTMFRFTLAPDGAVSDINELPVKLVDANGQPGQGGF